MQMQEENDEIDAAVNAAADRARKREERENQN